MDNEGIWGLIDSYLDGNIDDADAKRLAVWLRSNKSNVRTFAQRMMIHQQLRDAMLIENSVKSLQAAEAPAIDMSDKPVIFSQDDMPATGGFAFRLPFFAFAMVLVAMLSGGVAYYWGRLGARAEQGTFQREVADRGKGPEWSQARSKSPSSIARLINVTNCRWDESLTTADFKNGGLQPGQALHLLEGVAEINSTLPSGGRGTFQLEGPLAMILTSEGMPSLLYGRLAGTFTNDYDQFTLDTPLGRVVVPGDAAIGVVAAANEVEVHVFSGKALFELWSKGMDDTPDQLIATDGASIQIKVASDGRISVHRDDAHEDWFVTPTAIAASQLAISSDYVAAIRKAKPVGYWRFESIENDMIRNEMSDRLHCRVVGDAVRLQNGRGENRTGQFGLTSGPGYLFSDEVVDDLIDEDYSVEVWVKPAYYHHGALFSLIDWKPDESPQNRHRVHLELCGPVSGYAMQRIAEAHPGRIRLLHRGRQCFSTSPYLLRKWQHIVGLKEGADVRVYVDGEKVGEMTTVRTLGDGMHVLMGQLYPRNPHVTDEVTSRLFVGEMDEVALYDRALSDDEIESHFQLAKPVSASVSD